MVMAQKQIYRSMEHRIEIPEMKLQLYGQLIFEKVGKNMQWKKKTVSSTNGVGKT